MKKSALNPAAYGLTVDEATRLVRLHDMCAGMAPEDFVNTPPRICKYW